MSGRIVFGGFLAAVFAGSMVVLVVVLSRASDAGKQAITRFVDGAKAGRPVGAVVAPDERAAVTDLLRRTTSFSVSNFQSQSDTSCFWIEVSAGGDHAELRVVLADDEVRAVSARRRCECPIDEDEPCALR